MKKKKRKEKRTKTIDGLAKIALCFGVLVLFAALSYTGSFASAEGGGEQHAASLDEMMIFNIINFILLAALFIYLYRTRSSGAFEKRSLEVQIEMEEAAEAKKQAEAKYSEYKARIDRLDEDLKKIREMAKEDAEKERETILTEARKQSEKMIKQAEITAKQEVDQAKRDLRREAAELAAKMAEEIVKKAVTPEDQKKWVTSYIEKIGELR